jgi:hypothetical protein
MSPFCVILLGFFIVVIVFIVATIRFPLSCCRNKNLHDNMPNYRLRTWKWKIEKFEIRYWLKIAIFVASCTNKVRGSSLVFGRFVGSKFGFKMWSKVRSSILLKFGRFEVQNFGGRSSTIWDISEINVICRLNRPMPNG